MEQPRTWTVLELLRWTTEHFQSRGIESARLDAECLLAHALQQPRSYLHSWPERQADPAFRASVERPRTSCWGTLSGFPGSWWTHTWRGSRSA